MMDKDEQRMLKVVGIRRSWLYGGEFKKFFSFSDVIFELLDYIYLYCVVCF